MEWPPNDPHLAAGVLLKYSWYDFVFDESLLGKHIGRLRSGEESGPKPEQLITLFLSQLTKGAYGLDLCGAVCSLANIGTLLSGSPIPCPHGSVTVMNARGKALLKLTAMVALEFRYGLHEVRSR